MPSRAQAVIGYRRRKPATARNNPLHPLARGKLLHYPLLAPYGNVLYDLVTGLTATWQARGGFFGIATQAGGIFGPCLNMRGGASSQGSGMAVANSAQYKPSSALTIAAWVNPDGVTSNYNQISGIDYRNDGSWSSPYFAHALGLGYGGNLTPSIHVAVAGSYTSIFAPSVVPTYTWSHVAGTYDGANLRLYVNGQQVATAARTGVIDYGNNGPLAIGNISTRATLPSTSQYVSSLVD